MSAELPSDAITAATKAVRTATLKVPCPEDREIALAVLEAAAPALRAQGAAAERDKIRAVAEEHDECCDIKWLLDLLDGGAQ